MAATAKMAHQMPNSNGKKYGTVSQDIFADGVVDHDMHLKMSKKIAQLTKVIYALNTKNDEHEHIIRTLQLQHESEKLQLIAETKTKFEALKSKIAADSELRMKIDALQTCVDEHEKQKKKYLMEFESYKYSVQQRESEIRAESNQTYAAMTKEMNKCQQEIQQKMNAFKSLIDAFERERDDAINDLRKAHQIEVENLLKTQRSQSGDVNSRLEALKAKHDLELVALQSMLDEVRNEKEQQRNDFEHNLLKTKAFYEKELEVMKHMQNSSASEQQKLLEDKLDKLKKDFQFQEAQYRRRIETQLSELSVAEELISQLKKQLEDVKMKDSENTDIIKTLESQLENAKRDTAAALSSYNETDLELRALNKKYADHSADLLHKSGLLRELTASNNRYEVMIQQLQSELSGLQEKLIQLMEGKDLLQAKAASELQEKSLELQTLQRNLEDLRKEKLAQQDEFEAEIVALKQQLADSELRSAGDVQKRIQELHEKHSKEISRLKSQEEELRRKIEEEWSSKCMLQLQNLEGVSQEEQERLQKEILQLTTSLQTAQNEIQQLMKAIGDKTSGLDAATMEVTSLQQLAASLKKQLGETSADLQSSRSDVAILREEIDKLKASINKLLNDKELDHKAQLDALNKSLESFWMQKLRAECNQLRTDLETQFARDKYSALQQLGLQKDQDLEKLAREQQIKISQLQIQIERLESALERARQSSEQLGEALNTKYQKQIQELSDRVHALTEEYERQLADVKRRKDAELIEVVSSKDKEMQVSVMELKSKHVEDMQAQLTAHRSAMEMIRREAELLRRTDLEKQETAHIEEKKILQNDLETKHQKDLEANTQNFMKQITASRMELQRAVELRNQKERELQMTSEELSDRIAQRDRLVKSLEQEVGKLNDAISLLNKDIENKGKDILNLRSEATKKLKQREEYLAQEHAENIELLQSRHAEETQQVLAEFSKAQDLLKNKISELSDLLELAEERYRNREPREEDLVSIEQLKRALAAREHEMQQLLIDKQYYQMELVNRETNFTKVFAGSSKGGPAQPQVGFINPLAKKKKGEKGPTKYAVSVPALDAMSSPVGSGNPKLRPIAGSPVHDEKLNPNHVLPPPQAFTKKFVQ